MKLTARDLKMPSSRKGKNKKAPSSGLGTRSGHAGPSMKMRGAAEADKDVSCTF